MIQVFILTYNRPSLVANAIVSVLSQSFQDLQLVVSDNSDNDETSHLIHESFSQEPRLSYIKRTPSVTAIDHFNLVLSEVTEDYFMMFHDDDTMEPHMIEKLHSQMIGNDSISAVGCNAFMIRNGKRSGCFRKCIHGYSMIENRNELISAYLGNMGCVPFPGYLYRKSKTTGLILNIAQGGKYCDVAYLMSVIDHGKFIWINEPLMNYFFHEGQDSFNDSFLDRIKLIRFISKTTLFKTSHPKMKVFRLINIYGQVKNRIFKENRPLSFSWYLKILYIGIKLSPFKVFPKLLYYLPSNLKSRNHIR